MKKIKVDYHWAGGTIKDAFEVNVNENLLKLAEKHDLMIVEKDGKVSVYIDDKGKRFKQR